MPRRTLLDRFTRGLLRVSIATGNVSAQTATSDDAPHPRGHMIQDRRPPPMQRLRHHALPSFRPSIWMDQSPLIRFRIVLGYCHWALTSISTPALMVVRLAAAYRLGYIHRYLSARRMRTFRNSSNCYRWRYGFIRTLSSSRSWIPTFWRVDQRTLE